MKLQVEASGLINKSESIIKYRLIFWRHPMNILLFTKDLLHWVESVRNVKWETVSHRKLLYVYGKMNGRVFPHLWQLMSNHHILWNVSFCVPLSTFSCIESEVKTWGLGFCSLTLVVDCQEAPIKRWTVDFANLRSHYDVVLDQCTVQLCN